MKATPSEVDQLVRQYADSERSDTFASYNAAIVLAREVRKLRRTIARLKRQAKTDVRVAATLARGGRIAMEKP